MLAHVETSGGLVFAVLVGHHLDIYYEDFVHFLFDTSRVWVWFGIVFLGCIPFGLSLSLWFGYLTVFFVFDTIRVYVLC